MPCVQEVSVSEWNDSLFNVIYLFSFLNTGTAYYGDCAVSINGYLMRQYRACVIDSLGLGITTSLYKAS